MAAPFLPPPPGGGGDQSPPPPGRGQGGGSTISPRGTLASPVAVIGAGFAGLACAVELASAGHRVTVFEASRSLGGRARRVELGGHALDNGQHLLIGAYRETLRLMRAVGVDPDLALLRQPLHLAFDDGFTLRAPRLPAPLHLAWGLLRAPLAWSERRAALAFMAALKRCAFRPDAVSTVAELLATHRQTPSLCSHLWEPLCQAALNTPASEASAQVFAAVLRDSLAGPREASDLLQPAVDLGSLFPEPAAAYVAAHGGTVLRGCGVKTLRRSGEDFLLDTDGAEHRFRRVVLAVAPYHLATLLAELPELDALAGQVAALRHEPIATAYLAYPAEIRLPADMIGLTGGHAQWAIDRGRIARQPGLVAAVISAGGPWQALSRDELLDGIHRQLRSLLPALPAPRWTQLIVEKRATFACTPKARRPAMRSALPGLLLAGYSEAT